MSVGIRIKNAVKIFDGKKIIDKLNVTIKPGEFFTLLGPSGCGKTTLLRMIAGFNSIEGGDFYFNDKRINDLDPSKRNIGMVFQNYAIFPHLSVRKNVEFGLQNLKMDRTKIHEQAESFLKLMQIDQFANRMPAQLSGGQQQRVAIARALCIEPHVLLMDEPLSNLDAKLRIEMRSAIRELQRQIGITTIYVTHDQEEAMAVSDRIAVLNSGTIQQIGTPKAIYQRPANTFVASFIGHNNLIQGSIKMQDNKCMLTILNYTVEIANIQEQYKKDQDVLVSIRPEEFLMQPDDFNGISAKVHDCIFLGLNTHIIIELENGMRFETIQVSRIDDLLQKGKEVKLGLDINKINIFTLDGSTNILTGVKNDNEQPEA
ncbi:MAG: ABC transporter ATP-binding protein [Treponema sp.]|nr:ABC transporter ATP-binding protein [Treponema sp.]